MFIILVLLGIVSCKRFAMWCKNRLLKKCCEFLFVMFGWLAHCVNQTSLSYVDCSERSILFNLMYASITFLSKKSACNW